MNIWQRFTSCRQFLQPFSRTLFPICMQTCCCITKKTSYIMIASICGAVLNIVLNAVLIPLFGYQAAAYSMLIAFVFLSYVQMRVSKKTALHYHGNQGNRI
ncbi:MAG: polysaccharide biosynthesis C-terminal domain-containing protein [Bifidobacterium longum]